MNWREAAQARYEKMAQEWRESGNLNTEAMVILLLATMPRALALLTKAEEMAKFYADPQSYLNDTVDIGVGEQEIPGTSQVIADDGRAARAFLTALRAEETR